MKLLFPTIVLLLVITPAISYNVLMMMAMGSRSHKNALDPIAAKLAQNEHQVTLMSPYRESHAIPGVNNVFLSKTADLMELLNFNFFDGEQMGISLFFKIFGSGIQACNLTYNEEPEIVKLVQHPKAHKYDVLIVDGIMNEYLFALGPHLGIPTIAVSPIQRMFPTAWALNIPSAYANVPLGLEFTIGPMTFSERLKGALMQVAFMLLQNAYLLKEFDEIIGKVIPDSPPLYEVTKKISFMMANSHPSVHHSIPAMPYFIEVGCLHCKKPKSLPKELEDYMQSSRDDGVIYFSLGSVQKGSAMPMEMRDKIMHVFAKLPQKIVWKYDNEIEGLPKNIKTINWAPQQDILAHNITRLFITHGGGLSSMEAAYHGCPLLGFPLSAEQWGNLANAVNKGYAEALDWKTFTEEQLYDTINLMLTNARYQDNAAKMSSLLKDRPQEPVDTAAYWIEYIIRHKGAPHLKSGAEELNLFQYLLLDVVASVVVITSIILISLFLLLRTCFRCIFKSNNTKLKSN